ncbi:4798_t:CDS:2 [Diversispora eburnea]|uniref:4798_t:CDS:1 n=1 Tax=Diversispora eburnea TaxID=1213867 RepID=A0A9N9BQH0_9GLOM|nr:4798_t:CDS:2 [Diversispora eburnea]
MKNLMKCFQKYCIESVNELTQNEVMDLTLSSEFILRYTDEDEHICTHQQWDNKLESLSELEEDPFLKKVETLPNLRIHEYVHPSRSKEGSVKFSNIQSSTKQEGCADHSDGIAYITTEKQYEICVIKGSRPYVIDDKKEMSDFVQNARVEKDIINYTVVSN